MPFLLINKPTGPTSHDIINQLRRIIRGTHPLRRGVGDPSQEGTKKSPPLEGWSASRQAGVGIKVGHAGTLDPFASGLLIVGVGREATKQLGQFQKLDKTYRAVLKLGATSDTYDKTGRVTVIAETPPIPPLSKGRTTYYPLLDKEGLGEVRGNTLEDVLLRFECPQLQTPPMFSAKKVDGKKLYELARKGKIIERKPQWVMVYNIKMTQGSCHTEPVEVDTNRSLSTLRQAQDDNELPCIELTIHCSSGTYIRSLAHDIGQALGCGAYLEELQRTAIGPYELKEAVDIDDLNVENWKTYARPLDPLSVVSCQLSVLVFGTFDNLHPGHIDFFRQAKDSLVSPLKRGEMQEGGVGEESAKRGIKPLRAAHGHPLPPLSWVSTGHPSADRPLSRGRNLIVGIARDNVVEKIKSRRPQQDELTRLKAVRACADVTAAYLLPENPDHRWDWIKRINPSVIFLGYDQTTYTEEIEKELSAHDIHCIVQRGVAYKPKTYKSSLIKRNA